MGELLGLNTGEFDDFVNANDTTFAHGIFESRTPSPSPAAFVPI